LIIFEEKENKQILDSFLQTRHASFARIHFRYGCGRHTLTLCELADRTQNSFEFITQVSVVVLLARLAISTMGVFNPSRSNSAARYLSIFAAAATAGTATAQFQFEIPSEFFGGGGGFPGQVDDYFFSEAVFVEGLLVKPDSSMLVLST